MSMDNRTKYGLPPWYKEEWFFMGIPAPPSLKELEKAHHEYYAKRGVRFVKRNWLQRLFHRRIKKL